MTFLDLLPRDLCFFEMDVLIVKCLKEEKQKLLMSAVGSILSQALFKVKHRVNTYNQRVSSVIRAPLSGRSLASFSTSYVFDWFILIFLLLYSQLLDNPSAIVALTAASFLTLLFPSVFNTMPLPYKLIIFNLNSSPRSPSTSVWAVHLIKPVTPAPHLYPCICSLKV